MKPEISLWLEEEVINNDWEKTAKVNDRCFIKAVIDRFEKNKAVIKTDDGQELLLPIETLPDGATEGGVVRLIISTKESDTQEREEIAKTLLNQILRIEEET